MAVPFWIRNFEATSVRSFHSCRYASVRKQNLKLRVIVLCSWASWPLTSSLVGLLHLGIASTGDILLNLASGHSIAWKAEGCWAWGWNSLHAMLITSKLAGRVCGREIAALKKIMPMRDHVLPWRVSVFACRRSSIACKVICTGPCEHCSKKGTTRKSFKSFCPVAAFCKNGRDQRWPWSCSILFDWASWPLFLSPCLACCAVISRCPVGHCGIQHLNQFWTVCKQGSLHCRFFWTCEASSAVCIFVARWLEIRALNSKALN